MRERFEIGALGRGVVDHGDERGGVDFGGMLGRVGARGDGVDIERARQFIEDERLLGGRERHGFELFEDRVLFGGVDLAVCLGGSDHGADERFSQFFALGLGRGRGYEAVL